MKTFNKITLLVLSIIILFSFVSCGAEQNNESESESKAETVSNTVVTEEATLPATSNEFVEDTTSSFDKNNYSPKISKSTAKEKGKKALQEYIKNELNSAIGATNTDEFKFDRIELIMPDEPSGVFERDNYGNVVDKKFKHPYWCIYYKYTPELCDFAYFFIDAENGEILYSGSMGD